MPALAAATYLPDSQVITLTKNLDAFYDPQRLKGFASAETISFFFHEWLHYLHNVSTIQGLSAYGNLVSLWSDFRHTTDSAGKSSGSVTLPVERALQVRQKQRYLRLTRTERAKKITPDVNYYDFSIKEVSKNEEKIEGLDVMLTSIQCALSMECGGGPSEGEMEIGTHEIIESAAWMLESKLCVALGGIPTIPPVSPYQVVRKLVQHEVPGIGDDLVIACMLCALQDSDPPSLLLEAIAQVKQAIAENEAPFARLEAFARAVLSEQEAWIEKQLGRIERVFVVDEAMALAVRSTVATIQRNFDKRSRDPFFEFELVELLSRSPAYMDGIMGRYGACEVI